MQGFAPHPSGLLVPEEHARTREVWTREDWRAYEKFHALAAQRGLAVKLRCEKPGCPDHTLTFERIDRTRAHIRCGCTDRVFMTAF